MSLLVINSTSRVARGLIKSFANAGSHDKILCADLFPNYKAIEGYLQLTQEVSSPQRLTDLKITGKQSLVDAIERADQVVYVTHQHYLNVPAKTSMFENVIKIVLVTPSEYDHISEPEPEYTKLLDGAAAKYTHLRLDLTFDEDSQIVHNTILRRISSGSSLYFDAVYDRTARSPVKVSDVYQAVKNSLANDQLTGKSYFLQGEEAYTFKSLIELLEETAERKAHLNECRKEATFKPTSFGPFSELLYTTCYINSQGIIHSGRTGKADSRLLPADNSLLEARSSLRSYYAPGKFKGMKDHGHSFLKKFLLY